MGVGNRQFLAIFCALCIVLISSKHSPAVANIVFNQSLSKSSELLVTKFFDEDRGNIDIAKADLNDDGVYEYIAKPRICDKGNNFCEFNILAESNYEIVELGTIKARSIQIDSDYSFGVRNIKAFDNPLNDFDYSLYIWEAGASRYMIKSEGANTE